MTGASPPTNAPRLTRGVSGEVFPPPSASLFTPGQPSPRKEGPHRSDTGATLASGGDRRRVLLLRVAPADPIPRLHHRDGGELTIALAAVGDVGVTLDPTQPGLKLAPLDTRINGSDRREIGCEAPDVPHVLPLTRDFP